MFQKLWHSTLVRYCIIGGTSYAVELSVLLCLHLALHLQRTIATGIAFWIGLVVAFVLQKLLAFRDYDKEVKTIAKQGTIYGILVAWNYVFTLTLVSVFPDNYLVYSRTAALIITTIWNYFIYQRFIFNSSSRNSVRTRSSDTKKHLYRSPYRLLLWLSLLLLIAISLFGAWYASADRSTNGDAIVFPYLFSGNFWPNKIMLATIHSQTLKYPIFFLQAHLPYDYFTYSLANYAVVLATVICWILITMKMLGHKAAVGASVALALFLAASKELNMQIVYTTVRNIEFPIVLLMTYVMARSIADKSYLRSHRLVASISYLLFCATIAGDKYFIAMAAAPLCAWILISLIWKKCRNRFSIFSLGALILAVPASLVINKILEVLGIYSSSNSYAPPVNIVNSHTIIPSIKATLQQFGGLIGINGWFNNWLITFVLLALVAVGIAGFLFAIKDFLNRRYASNDNAPIWLSVAAAVLFTACISIYIVTGYGISVHGSTISQFPDNDRYISFMPFLLVIGIAYAVKGLKNIPLYTYVGLVSLLAIIVALSALPKINTFRENVAARQLSYKALAEQLNQEGVQVELGGYWYGATTRFWSGDNVITAPVNSCNHPYIPNARADWYTPSPTVDKSAYVIDPVGPDDAFFGDCNEHQLRTIFGAPEKIVHSPSYVEGKPLNIWIYPYDIRTKLVQL